MDARQMYDFAVGQVAWYEKDIERTRSHIAFCNRELKRTRKEDKELKAWALERNPDDPLTLSIYGGEYVGRETSKYINERARHYRNIKHNKKMIQHFRKEAEFYERYIG